RQAGYGVIGIVVGLVALVIAGSADAENHRDRMNAVGVRQDRSVARAPALEIAGRRDGLDDVVRTWTEVLIELIGTLAVSQDAANYCLGRIEELDAAVGDGPLPRVKQAVVDAIVKDKTTDAAWAAQQSAAFQGLDPRARLQPSCLGLRRRAEGGTLVSPQEGQELNERK